MRDFITIGFVFLSIVITRIVNPLLIQLVSFKQCIFYRICYPLIITIMQNRLFRSELIDAFHYCFRHLNNEIINGGVQRYSLKLLIEEKKKFQSSIPFNCFQISHELLFPGFFTPSSLRKFC